MQWDNKTEASLVAIYAPALHQGDHNDISSWRTSKPTAFYSFFNWLPTRLICSRYYDKYLNTLCKETRYSPRGLDLINLQT